MPLRLLLLLLLIFLLPAVRSAGQPGGHLVLRHRPSTWFIGPTGGYNYAIHGAFQSVGAGDISPADLGTGTGGEFFAGIMVARTIHPSRFFFTGTICFDRRPGSAEADGPIMEMRDPAAGDSRQGRTRAGGDIGYDMIAIDLIPRLLVVRKALIGLSVGAGPTLGYLLSATSRESLRPVDSADRMPVFPANSSHTVSGDGRTIVMNDGARSDAARLRFGVKAGLSVVWQIGYGSSTLIVPSIMFDYGVTPAATGKSWRVHAVQFGLGMVFGLPGESYWESDESLPLLNN